MQWAPCTFTIYICFIVGEDMMCERNVMGCGDV